MVKPIESAKEAALAKNVTSDGLKKILDELMKNGGKSPLNQGGDAVSGDSGSNGYVN